MNLAKIENLAQFLKVCRHTSNMATNWHFYLKQQTFSKISMLLTFPRFWKAFACLHQVASEAARRYNIAGDSSFNMLTRWFRWFIPVGELYILQSDATARPACAAGEIHRHLCRRGSMDIVVLHIADLYARILANWQGNKGIEVLIRILIQIREM